MSEINKEMQGIILDKSNFKQNDKILEKVRPEKNDNMIVLFVNTPVFFNFHQSDNQKKIVNENDFLDSVQYSLCGKYDKNANTVYLKQCKDEYVKILLETLHKYFEDSLKIVLPFSRQNTLEGFSSPEPCIWDNNQICVKRPNTFLTEEQKQSNHFEIEYLKSQTQNEFCTIIVNLEQDSIEYLKYLTKAGVTKSKNGKRSQKEVFGKFFISKTILQNNEIIHTLKIDKNTIVFGSEDEVKTTGSLYSFHSHPFSAYLQYETNYGVPSASDYFAVYTLCRKFNAIMHFVSSLEGLYVLSCNPQNNKFQNTSSDEIKKIIWANLKLHKGDKVTNLEKYIQKVNNLGMFRLLFIPWEKVKDQNISVIFRKVGKACLIRD